MVNVPLSVSVYIFVNDIYYNILAILLIQVLGTLSRQGLLSSVTMAISVITVDCDNLFDTINQ